MMNLQLIVVIHQTQITSVNKSTIDESPFAYKSLEDIIDFVKETVDIDKIIKPVYNFKASESEFKKDNFLSDLLKVFLGNKL